MPTRSPARTNALTVRPTPDRSSRSSGGGAMRSAIDPRLLPKSPLAKALNYARERRSGLEVFLDDPDVAIDTNHIERALRPIPLGKRNWLFASSEVGAQRGRHHPDPAGDVPAARGRCLHLPGRCASAHQRASGQPRHRTHPAMWKSLFADDPLRLRPQSAPSRSAATLTAVPQPRPILPAYVCRATQAHRRAGQGDPGTTARPRPRRGRDPGRLSAVRDRTGPRLDRRAGNRRCGGGRIRDPRRRQRDEEDAVGELHRGSDPRAARRPAGHREEGPAGHAHRRRARRSGGMDPI